ncbi:MAG: NAD(P)-dependent oxidoreductase [Lachnospiraceae bacterium]|nr:NAD(P)-dependent oxidoreductase [Lachnospiraceae bacterium]
MKIAVVGGRGFIGSEFVKYAAGKGHDPVVMGSDIDVFSQEGRDKASQLLSGCDAVVFLAAKRPTAEFGMEQYIYNLRLAERYFELAKEAGINNVAVTSSRSVYSSDDIPWVENDLQAPLSLYGASKQAVDSLVLWYNKAYDMKIKSLRLAQVIGMGEKKGFLLNTLIDNAIAGKKQTVYGKGIGKRQYIYVKDVCDALLHCVEKADECAGIYNIGMDCNVSIVELTRVVNEVFNNTAGMELLEDKPEDTKEYLMDVRKAERELRWKPGFDLVKAFEDIKKEIV